VNLGEAEFPQGEFISPEDFKSMGPHEIYFVGEQGQAGELDPEAPVIIGDNCKVHSIFINLLLTAGGEMNIMLLLKP